MSNKAWFPFYVGDFLADTSHLSTVEVGAYVLLICHYWRTGPLPTDETRLRNICRLSRHNFSKSKAVILKFFVLENEKYLHKRIDKEISKANEITKKNTESGKRGGLASAMLKTKRIGTQSQSQSHSKEKSRETPRKKRATALPQDWKLPDDYREYCKTKRPDLNPDATAENFQDYYLSIGKPMVDWKRTWQRWVRNERGAYGKKPESTGGSASFKTFDPTAPAEIVAGINPYEESA